MSSGNLPDWHLIAEKFDMWLPYIEPAGEAMLAALQVQPGDRVLDVASGTGEPALTLAQRMKTVDVVGTDAADGMVKVAQAKVEKLGLPNLSFSAMPGEKLDFPDASFDKLMCRFGVMFFKDTVQGLKEMCRVLKAGGRFSFAVWNTPETMPIMNWNYMAFRDKIPDESLPAMDVITSLGVPGLFKNVLQQAGFRDISVRPHTLYYTFDSFEHYWDMLEASDLLKVQFEALPDEQRDSVRDEVAKFAGEFITDTGLHVPHEYLLATGIK